MRVVRIVGPLFLGTVLLACLAGTMAVADLSTAGLYRRLGGITIESEAGHARIVRRHLDCASLAPDSTSESCRVAIDGDALTVDVTHHPTSHFGFAECSAAYRGAKFGCRAGTYTVSGPPHAIVDGLELPDDVMQALRRQHLLTSLGEREWERLAASIATLLALGVALVVLGWVPARVRSRWTLAAASGVGTFMIADVALLMVLLTTDFMD